MNLSNLKPAKGSKQSNNFRKGRGHGSGNGRIPKRGFTNRNSKDIVAINVDRLEKFNDGDVVTIEALREKGIISNPKDGVKVLGNGELTKKLTIQVNAFSKSAIQKIEALGGKAEVI